MMISPEGYYETSLKGKNEEQILMVIRGLKQEITALINIMESADYNSAYSIDPDESTRLCCTRLYLEQAKQALADVGGRYVPSKAEIKALSFDSIVPLISKVTFQIGGYCNGYETRIFTLDDEHLHLTIDSFPCPPPSNLHERVDYPCNKEIFLDRIKELHIGEWRTKYMNPDILDGTQWELKIEFVNGNKSFKSVGSNAYPYNFDELKKLLGIDLKDKEYDNE